MIPDPLIGRVVDSRYEVRARVARGGMATVYLAHDKRLDRDVALKLMHAHLAESPDFVARFRREARAAARLSAPGVVAVYDQGSVDGVAYLVMELVDGPTLRDLLGTEPLSVERALDLTEQVLRPLGAAHRAGLVHRDVKPENVLLPPDGSAAKVADFGLARAVTEATQTTTGNILGTVAYLAPELITVGTSSPAVDVYAVGVMLYEMLTGTQPLAADSPVQTAFRAVHEDVPAPSRVLPGLPSAVDDLVAALTQRDPQRRPADADAALALVRTTHESLSADELALIRTAVPGASGTWSTQPSTRTVSLPVGSVSAAGAPGAITRPSTSTARLSDLQRQDTEPTPVPATHADATTRPRRRTRRAVLAVALLALAGAGGSGAWYMTAGPGRRVTVPRLAGQTQEQARAALTGVDLAWGSPTHAYSDTVPEGRIISTTPAAGAKARVGSAVIAVLSRGVEHKDVPDVTGMTQEEATAAITKAGLKLGSTSEDYSQTVPAGSIISCEPAAGTSMPHDSPVALVVSKGREPATVPDVVGKPTQEATTALSEAGLTVSGTTEAFSDSVPAGSVISSEPSAGAREVYVGDSVALIVSKGPEMVTVPDVTSQSESKAKAALEGAGLTVTVNRVLGGIFGTARTTDPAAGTKVRKGSTVTLYVV